MTTTKSLNSQKTIIHEKEKYEGIKYTIDDYIYNLENKLTKEEYAKVNSSDIKDIYRILKRLVPIKVPSDFYQRQKSVHIDTIFSMQDKYRTLQKESEEPTEQKPEESNEQKPVESNEQKPVEPKEDLPTSKNLSIQNQFSSFNPVKQNKAMKKQNHLFDISHKLSPIFTIIDKEDADIKNEYSKHEVTNNKNELLIKIEKDEYNDNLEHDENKNNYPTCIK